MRKTLNKINIRDNSNKASPLFKEKKIVISIQSRLNAITKIILRLALLISKEFFFVKNKYIE